MGTVDEWNLEIWTMIFNLCDKYKYEPVDSWTPTLATKRIVTRIMDHASFGRRSGSLAVSQPGYGFCFAVSMLQDFTCDSSPVCEYFEWTSPSLGLLDGTKCDGAGFGALKGKFVDFIDGGRDVRG